ncbi:hypothetical protein, partial [Photobacterium leiognathi]|uniref:hypothetical protein n=1 Tax=Photobacterium leiognathi TaxID=553611 RepID=UPI00273655CF
LKFQDKKALNMKPFLFYFTPFPCGRSSLVSRVQPSQNNAPQMSWPIRVTIRAKGQKLSFAVPSVAKVCAVSMCFLFSPYCSHRFFTGCNVAQQNL